MKKLKALSALALALSLSACGFHLRSAADFPPTLHKLVVECDYPYFPFCSQLSAYLRIPSSPTHIPGAIRVVILHNDLSHSNPPMISSNMAISYVFTLNTVVALKSPKGEIIAGPQTFVSSRVLVLNNNLVLNSSIGASAKADIIRNNINKLYFWLISQNTQRALNHYFSAKRLHANHTARIKKEPQ